MVQAKQGDIVQVHYVGKLDDGFIFDSSIEKEPLQFTIGEGYVLEGFEQAVVGMTSGENKVIQIVADKAYGPYREDLVMTVGRDQFPNDTLPEIGHQIRIGQNKNDYVIATIVDVNDEQVTMDANHPLAGRDLTFEVQLVSIVS